MEDNLWAHSEHLAIHGRCSPCIGCHQAHEYYVSARQMAKKHTDE